MRYLLDVNILVALGMIEHTSHVRVTNWIMKSATLTLATSAITELGFVRVISQIHAYELTVAEAKSQLLALKGLPNLTWEFLSDDQDASTLPPWVKSGKQTTDGHLVELAKTHGMILATLDKKIPGAFVIP